ncbi:uncharacterized protein LOC105845183 isoform X2 [Hydra vulgaris]|uniref:Uncharacterized protein LOC105845183 isoform X2 n=1 Tax=Hydra vulgaris TaxID=6087 RepID=A0ABM4D0D4_HYDVU
MSVHHPVCLTSDQTTKVDGLCAITSQRLIKTAESPGIEYEINYYNDAAKTNSKQIYIPREIKEINKDLKTKTKRDILTRPEFLSKQHELKCSAAKKKEAKDIENSNELFQKLKTRTEKIEQLTNENTSSTNEKNTSSNNELLKATKLRRSTVAS